ncbi:MAG TPA: ATP-binding protein, partial [Caulobacteraceae bacterium]|nr:ATP-binding protein [Caulobacteraceae bacterium]
MTSDVDKRQRRRTLRSKLVTLVLASVGLAVALVAGATTWRDVNRDAALQSERLASQAAILASVTSAATQADDRPRAYLALRAIAKMPGVSYARVETASGALLAETGSGVRLSTDAQYAAGKQPSLWSLMSSRTVEVSAPIVAGRARIGRIVVVGRLEGEGGRVLQSLAISLGAAALAAIAGLLVAWRLQRNISRPIIALTAAVNHIRDTHDYAGRADVAADDEVADLVGGFNAMLGEIETRDAAIARHLEGLEQTVAERTADLKLAKDAAEAATNAKSEFLATMSHEIRTPMNGVMVMAEMLAGSELPPKQRRFADLIAKSGSSLLAIINDILDLSKIEAGKLELEQVPVEIGEVAEDVCGLFWERAREKGLDLAAFVDPATPKTIVGDEVRLRQVIGNLVNNAIKFTEAGGVLVRIEPLDGGRLRIAVQDTGIGIAADKLDSVFGAFSQADQSTTRKFGGTGLGLAICKRLVESMDGRISVASTPGKGSKFTIELPMIVDSEAAPWPRLDSERGVVALAGVATRAAMTRYLASAGLQLVALDRALDDGPGLLFADPTVLDGATGGLEA